MLKRLVYYKTCSESRFPSPSSRRGSRGFWKALGLAISAMVVWTLILSMAGCGLLTGAVESAGAELRKTGAELLANVGAEIRRSGSELLASARATVVATADEAADLALAKIKPSIDAALAWAERATVEIVGVKDQIQDALGGVQETIRASIDEVKEEVSAVKEEVSDSIGEVKATLASVKEDFDDGIGELRAKVDDLDTDGDGKISTAEAIAGATGLVTVLGLGGRSALRARGDKEFGKGLAQGRAEAQNGAAKAA